MNIKSGINKQNKKEIRPAQNIRGKRYKIPKILININQFYVLHKIFILRVLSLIFIFFLALFIYQKREEVGNFAQYFNPTLSRIFSSLGFNIEQVQINGHLLTSEAEILSVLNLEKNSSTINFDAKKARKNLLSLPAIADVNVRKSLPNKLLINITEFEPIAIWQVGGESYLINEKGKKIAKAQNGANDDLIFVIGKGGAENASIILNAIKRHTEISKNIYALSRIADRRWDIIYKNGLRVRLPEFGVDAALSRLEHYQQNYSLFNKDINLIDLRVDDLLVVRLIEREEI